MTNLEEISVEIKKIRDALEVVGDWEFYRKEDQFKDEQFICGEFKGWKPTEEEVYNGLKAIENLTKGAEWLTKTLEELISDWD